MRATALSSAWRNWRWSTTAMPCWCVAGHQHGIAVVLHRQLRQALDSAVARIGQCTAVIGIKAIEIAPYLPVGGMKEPWHSDGLIGEIKGETLTPIYRLVQPTPLELYI